MGLCLYICVAGMLPGYDKQHTTDTQVSEQNIHPDVGGEGVEKGEHPGVGAVGLAVQYTYPQRQEGFGKVDDLLPRVRDGQRRHCKISFLPTNNAQGKER